MMITYFTSLEHLYLDVPFAFLSVPCSRSEHMAELAEPVYAILACRPCQVAVNLSTFCVVFTPLCVALKRELIACTWDVASYTRISAHQVSTLLQQRCRRGYVLVLEPRAPHVVVLFINGKVEILDLFWKANTSNNPREASADANHFHGPVIIDSVVPERWKRLWVWCAMRHLDRCGMTIGVRAISFVRHSCVLELLR